MVKIKYVFILIFLVNTDLMALSCKGFFKLNNTAVDTALPSLSSEYVALNRSSFWKTSFYALSFESKLKEIEKRIELTLSSKSHLRESLIKDIYSYLDKSAVDIRYVSKAVESTLSIKSVKDKSSLNTLSYILKNKYNIDLIYVVNLEQARAEELNIDQALFKSTMAFKDSQITSISIPELVVLQAHNNKFIFKYVEFLSDLVSKL